MQVEQEQETQQPKVSWVKQVYQRVPWLRVRYGRTVRPQNQQSSNVPIADEQVMQRRDAPIVSFAWPLNKSADIPEESGAKR